MAGNERRSGEKPRSAQMRHRLNQEQQLELAVLERFGWELKFIRQPQFGPPVAVVYDSSTGHYAVLTEDGSLDEKSRFEIRS